MNQIIKKQMEKYQLDQLDKKIMQLISEDARIPFLEVARLCNVSGAAIHQRIQKLTNVGVLKGSHFTIDPVKIGYTTCAYMGLFLKDPCNFEQAIEGLKKIPEVVECHLTTGSYDVFVKVYAKNNGHLLDILHEKLQPLGLSRTETTISYTTVFNRMLPVTDDAEEDSKPHGVYE